MQTPRHRNLAGEMGCQPAPPASRDSPRYPRITRRRSGWARTLLHYLVVASLVTSCTHHPIRPSAPVPSRPAPSVPGLRIEYGLASWYGRERYGRRTASGEIYASDKLTAAHRTAPFGTYARVTNLAMGGPWRSASMIVALPRRGACWTSPMPLPVSWIWCALGLLA